MEDLFKIVVRKSPTQDKEAICHARLASDDASGFVLESDVRSIGEECCQEAPEYLAQSRAEEEGE